MNDLGRRRERPLGSGCACNCRPGSEWRASGLVREVEVENLAQAPHQAEAAFHREEDFHAVAQAAVRSRSTALPSVEFLSHPRFESRGSGCAPETVPQC